MDQTRHVHHLNGVEERDVGRRPAHGHIGREGVGHAADLADELRRCRRGVHDLQRRLAGDHRRDIGKPADHLEIAG